MKETIYLAPDLSKAATIQYDTAMHGEHVRVYRDGRLFEHYIQSHGKTTCAVLRNCGEYGFLPCGEMMNTAAHLYEILCEQYRKTFNA